ncbi:MAG: hypothetical protein ACFFDN_15380 [Candidatus Hodarchaeota archaeon]
MTSKKFIPISCILFLIFGGSIFALNIPRILYSEQESNGIDSYNNFFNTKKTPKVSSGNNRDLIDSIFNNKIFEYYDLGYFPQIYESSLQATYYAVYILDSLGRLDQINQTEIVNYIMSFYEPSSNTFMDSYAYRYLDTDFSQFYYPLSTILETTCYAILSLDILNSSHLLDIQKIIDFIWSCHNPNSGGFIGQPYTFGLEDGFKIATADNTYFAVQTLDLLMNDWLGYSTQRDEIIQFINDLQLLGGGFLNDEDTGFDTLNPFFEPNLMTSYYSIKTLEVFGMEGTIRTLDFHQFLDSLYNLNHNYFRVSQWDYGVNYTNIVATALGLELSNITNYENIDRNATLSFIIENRNSFGNWNQSTTVTHHELIDTFQIIRSLKNVQELAQLTLEDRNQLGNATQFYKQPNGYSSLSNDYTSINLIHALISSFDLFDRESELDVQTFYDQIKNSYVQTFTQPIANSFAGYLIKSPIFVGFRSHPIEYYTSGNKFYLNSIDQLYSHKSSFLALESMKKLFKLDDFAIEFDLVDLVNDIISTQFLNDTYYDRFGAFTPLWFYQANRSEYLSKNIFFEYSYYAIRCLELLAEQLGLESINNLGFDVTALYNYIDRNIIETPTQLYFNPQYTNDVETVLRNTYYMIYVLQALNLYDKDKVKIKNYVLTNLDYNNIENIYYSYKISEILDLDIIFDIKLIHDLVQIIYSEDNNEFYLTSSQEIINQEIFLWICDMARNSDIGIETYYSNYVSLGDVNRIYASLYNLILRDFGTYITFKFESNQLGTYVFNKLVNNSYVADIPIPVSTESYPQIDGILCAYEGTQKKAELPISFSTTYNLIYDVSIEKTSSAVSFSVNGSINSSGKDYPLADGRVYIHVIKNDRIIETKQFFHHNFMEYSTFILTYTPLDKGTYMFEVYLDDGIQGSSILIASTDFCDNQNYMQALTIAIPLAIILMGVPGCVIIVSTKQINKAKKEAN